MFDPAKLVGYDTETHLIQPGLLAPPLVCASVMVQDSPELLSAAQARQMLPGLCLSDLVLTGANLPYDFGIHAADNPDCLALIFDKLDRGQVYDVQIAEILNAIADGTLGLDPRSMRPIKPEPGRKRGGYSLRFCVELRLGREDAKKHDLWRTRYAMLASLPIEEWPETARQYPLDDVRNPVEVAQQQIALHNAGEFHNLANMPAQVDTAFCLHLMSMWGLRTDRSRYEALQHMIEETHDAFVAQFRSYGFYKAHEDKEDEPAIKRAVALAYGVDPASVCERCHGSGKVPSTSPSALKSRTPKLINCKVVGIDGARKGCDSTGLDLDTGPAVPRTDSGGVSTSRDTLVESGDEHLMAYSENEGEKLRSTYLPFVEQGLDIPITPRPNVLVASGRSSYEEVIQQLPRSVLCLYCKGRKCVRCEYKGTVLGVRECFCARPGCVLCSVDYGAGELCTLARVCLWVCGHSEMARVIIETGDPGMLHLDFAADLLGVTLAEAVALHRAKDKAIGQARQGAKAFNFGLGGGMGAAKLVINKRNKREGVTRSPDGEIVYPGLRFCILLGGERRCGVEKVIEWKGRTYAPMCKRCVQVAEELRRKWFAKYPEVRQYHDWVSRLVDEGATFPCFRPCWTCGGEGCAECAPLAAAYGTEGRGWAVERYRGGLEFSEAANNGFQALLADAAKCGLRKLTRECYTDRSSPLYGSRPLLFLHDEVITEMPRDRAHAAANRQAAIMVSEGSKYVPKVGLYAQPALMKYICKDAEAKYNSDGQLIPWDE